jgi:hypothetical protein
MKKVTIYALKLVEGKYYIGMTRNMERRYREHKLGRGAAWTKMYRPIEILEATEYPDDGQTDFDLIEHQLTINYAYALGRDNVRGGRFVNSIVTGRQVFPHCFGQWEKGKSDPRIKKPVWMV